METNQIKNTHSLFIDMYRIILCFCVVLQHVPYNLNHLGIGTLVVNAVPQFILLSFFLCGKYFFNEKPVDVNYLKRRVLRLGIPYVFWGVVTLILYYTVFYGVSICSNYGFIKNMILQILFGHTVDEPLYYLMIIIYFTVIMFIFSYVKLKLRILLMATSIIISLVLQYSNLNYVMFSNVIYNCKYTLGRIVELLPYAITGILLNYESEKYNFKLSRSILDFVICITIILQLLLANKGRINGFGYQGVNLYIFNSILFFCIMKYSTYVKFNKVGILNMIICKLAPLTMGIYYIHFVVNTIIIFIISKFELRILDKIFDFPMIKPIVVFLFSIFIIKILEKIFTKKLKLVIS